MTASLAELRGAAHKRDASVSAPEVRFTNPTDWIADLQSDAALGAIEDNICRISIINAPATVEQVEGRWTPGGARQVLTYLSKHLEATYLARGQLVKLSCYCGVALKDNVTEPQWIAAGMAATQATGKAPPQALRKGQTGRPPPGPP